MKDLENKIMNIDLDFNIDNECSICLEPLDLHIVNYEETPSIINFINILSCNCLKRLFFNSKISVEKNYTCKFTCSHTFHKKCILEWFEKEKSCPICRRIYIKN